MVINIPHFVVLVTLNIFAALAHSVVPTELVQRQIDRTVWQPFQCAFEAMDGRALNKLYAKNVLRVTAAGIDTQNSFKAFNKTRFDEGRRNGDRVTLDFWFDSRTTSGSTSYNVGFFRLGTLDTAGATQYYYGQFHIVLRKQRGRWKIVQDWDTSTIAGRPLGAADFARGSAIEHDCR